MEQSIIFDGFLNHYSFSIYIISQLLNFLVIRINLSHVTEPDLTTFDIKKAKTTLSWYYSVVHSTDTLCL